MIVIALGGPFAMNVTGNVRDVVLTYISFIIFDDLNTTYMILSGIGISFIGSIFFIYSKM